MLNKVYDFGAIRPLQYFTGIAIFLGVTFSIISSPEDKGYSIEFLALWLLQTSAPIAILVFTHLQLHISTAFDRINPWLKLVLSGLTGALLFTPIALTLDFLWGNDALPDNMDALGSLLLDEASAIVPPVTICWVAMNAPWLLGYKLTPAQDEHSHHLMSEKQGEKDLPSEEKRELGGHLKSLLNIELTESPLYLKSELHYLFVVTERGSELVLYNLRDAIDEMPPDIGVQPHRSYWVAKRAVRRFKKQGRQGVLELHTGDQIPVSRNKLETIEAQSS